MHCRQLAADQRHSGLPRFFFCMCIHCCSNLGTSTSVLLTFGWDFLWCKGLFCHGTMLRSTSGFRVPFPNHWAVTRSNISRCSQISVRVKIIPTENHWLNYLETKSHKGAQCVKKHPSRLLTYALANQQDPAQCSYKCHSQNNSSSTKPEQTSINYLVLFEVI